MKRGVWRGAIAVAGLALSSCASDGPTVERSDGAERFRPVDLTIHPISHVQVQSDGTALVEAAVELTDADGFAVRGLGMLELEFHQGDRHGEAIMSRRTWSADLNDPHTNATLFDSMTRTYVVPVGLEAHGVPRSPRLRATLYRSGGEPLQDSMALAVLGPPAAAPQEASTTP